MAEMVVKRNVNSTSFCFIYQPKLPDGAKKFKKKIDAEYTEK